VAKVVHEPQLQELDDPWRPGGSLLLAVLALAWLVIDLGVAYNSVTSGVMATTQVALFLPSLTSAAATAGAAVGVLFLAWLGDRFGGVERALPRVLSGAAGGAVVAVIAAGGLLAAYRSGSAAVAVTITLAVVSIGGGALAAVRPTVVIAAGVAGMLVYTVVSFVEAYFRDSLLNLFGAGSTVASYTAADSRLSLVVSLVTGVLAGVGAFIFLRRTGLALPWPVYLGAGAVPGALLLASEGAAWLGGLPLRSEIGRYSEIDRFSLAMLQPGRVNHDLIVFFVGTVTALILVGRTMKSASSD
jgi:MFS family permease